MPPEFTSNFVEFVKNIYPSKDTIPLHVASFLPNELEIIKHCLDSGVISTYSQITTEFENKLISLTGIPYAVAMVNATMSLYLTMKYIGISEGDEVILPAISFIAAANSVTMLGAHPVFVDVDKKTTGMDIEKQ